MNVVKRMVSNLFKASCTTALVAFGAGYYHNPSVAGAGLLFGVYQLGLPSIDQIREQGMFFREISKVVVGLSALAGYTAGSWVQRVQSGDANYHYQR